MGVADREWYGNGFARRTTRRGDVWRAIRGLAIVAVAALAALEFGKTLLHRRGTVTFFGMPVVQNEPRPSSQPPAREAINLPTVRPPVTIYRCIVDGVLVYSGPQPCQPAGEVSRQQVPTPVQRAVTAESPSDGLTPYQREMLRSADARIARDAAAARMEVQAMQQRAANSNAECSSLAAQIVSLDAWARQPSSGSTQDNLRARRQDVRSRQAALRC